MFKKKIGIVLLSVMFCAPMFFGQAAFGQAAPRTAAEFNKRGLEYYDSDQYYKAIDDFTQAIRLDQSVWAYYNNRGLSYWYLDENDKAIADFNQALKLNPNNASVLAYRGDAYHDNYEFDKAIDDYTQAIKIKPDDYYAYQRRGYIYFKNSMFGDPINRTRALADFNKAIELNPTAFSYLYRANCYYMSDNYAQALADVSKALQINPNYQEAKELDATLRQLQAMASSRSSPQQPAAAAPVPNQTTQFDSNRADPDAANWDIAALDTAANASYLTGLEKDVILEMNKVRANPQKYAELYIQPRLRYYNGREYRLPGSNVGLLTQEGAAAVNECIAALRSARSVGVLKPEKGLSQAAKDLVTDQGRTGQTGHYGSDNSAPDTRMKRYGVFVSPYTWGENITYGSTTGRDIVCSLLIDDGVPDRGHRVTIMKADYTQTGVAYGTHPQIRTICTITYALGYKSN